MLLQSLFTCPRKTIAFLRKMILLFENEIISMCTGTHWWLNLQILFPQIPKQSIFFYIDNEIIFTLTNNYTILENRDIPVYRVSHDHRTNSHGLQLIHICRNNNLFIILILEYIKIKTMVSLHLNLPLTLLSLLQNASILLEIFKSLELIHYFPTVIVP